MSDRWTPRRDPTDPPYPGEFLCEFAVGVLGGVAVAALVWLAMVAASAVSP